MSVEERIRYLLRAASRAEGEGDRWVAHLFRRMADEARPMGPEALARAITSRGACSQE